LARIPEDHPRRDSLRQRELLVEGYRLGATAIEGLIAFGRGEAFDYLLGERTIEAAERAIEAGAALLLWAERPVISVNGNTAALCPGELVEVAQELPAKLEINLFHRTEERARVIAKMLRAQGAREVLGVEADAELPGLTSERRKVSREGIYSADAVLVALEDGDRTQALVKAGKKVVAIDLNPLSRTARAATITIVDNVVRVLPLLLRAVRRLRHESKATLEELWSGFDNQACLRESLRHILQGVERMDSSL